MIEQGLAPSTINRRLSALRSLVALGKEFGFVTFDLATQQRARPRPIAIRAGPEPDVMVALLKDAQGPAAPGQGSARRGHIPAVGLRPRLAPW